MEAYIFVGGMGLIALGGLLVTAIWLVQNHRDHLPRGPYRPKQGEQLSWDGIIYISFPTKYCPACAVDLAPPMQTLDATRVKGRLIPLVTHDELDQPLCRCCTCKKPYTLLDYFQPAYDEHGAISANHHTQHTAWWTRQ